MATDLILTKTCKGCGKDIPATIEFWHKQNRGKYGLRSKCKICSADDNKAYRSTPTYKERNRQLSAEWKRNNKEKSLEINRKHYAKFGHLKNEKRRERYLSDEEYKLKKKESDRKYQESGKRALMRSKEKNRIANRLRSKKRREDVVKKEQDNIQKKKWREQNKEYIAQKDKERRELLIPNYVAQSLRMKVRNLTPEILETKQLIIKIKRELKNNQIKIK